MVRLSGRVALFTGFEGCLGEFSLFVWTCCPFSMTLTPMRLTLRALMVQDTRKGLDRTPGRGAHPSGMTAFTMLLHHTLLARRHYSVSHVLHCATGAFAESNSVTGALLVQGRCIVFMSSWQHQFASGSPSFGSIHMGNLRWGGPLGECSEESMQFVHLQFGVLARCDRMNQRRRESFMTHEHLPILARLVDARFWGLWMCVAYLIRQELQL